MNATDRHRRRAGDAVKVVTFYRFVPLPDCSELLTLLRQRGEDAGLLGTVILASEGINATVAGPPAAVDGWLEKLADDPRFTGLALRTSTAEHMPFYRFKVQLRKEIVTLGQPDVRPLARTGRHVAARDWNQLLADPQVTVIDARNHFEVAAGTFEGALDPHTTSFGEFPEFVSTHLDPARHRKIAMFCTGGIRCEKASSWMLGQGFDEVYQLSGGILAYLEQIPAGEGRWNGACFVFDQRVAVGYGLERSNLRICRGCRHPLTPEALAHADFEDGVSCQYCAKALTEERRASLRERQRQVLLAEARGEQHIGKTQDSSDGR